MRLSAMDIRQQQFGVKLIRGFDPQEVDAFLEEVADDWEDLVKENNLLKEQLATLEDRTRDLEGREKTLQETLITTQKMAEEFKENSRRAAEIVLREAQLQAEKLLEETRQEQGKLMSEIAAFKQQRRQLAEELLSTLRMHQRLIEQKLAAPDAG
ncbi:MAG TPA: DivIVA domain-containing protein [Methylomirabilota bacterium]|jgi:cell division initiation protein|nr:DivIVA domain-containing protein [Methylomirabilota bacterium]